MAEAGLDRDQQFAQLVSLLVIETDEQCVLGFALGVGGVVEALYAGGREGHEVASSILRVAPACEQIFGLQGVQQRHENAGVDAHHLSEFGLSHRSVVVQQAEDVELPRREAVGGVRVP